MARRLGHLLQLRPGEVGPLAVLFAWYFCVIGAAFVGRAVRDALFLSHLGARQLPAMYIASPLIVTAVGLGYARVEGRLRRDRLVIATASCGGLALLGARALLGTGTWIFYVLYVGVSVLSGLVIMQLWTVAADRFTARDGKRLFGLIGAGGTVADIAIGAALAVLAPRIGAENLLVLAAGLLLAAAALAALLRRMSGGRLDARTRTAPRPGQRRLPPGAAHLPLVAAALVCSVVVVTLVEFQFKTVTAAHFGADRAGMVRYFGDMSIATGVIALALQLGATRRVLERLGITGALLVLPVALAAGEAGLLAIGGIVASTALKMGDETVRFTVNDAATQLLYLPVPSAVRGRWKALVDNVWKPGAQVVLGLALLAYGALDRQGIAPLAGAALVAIAAWIVLLVRLRPAFVRSLRETLRRRLDLGDGAAIPREELVALRGALGSADPATLRSALELARPLAAELAGELGALTAHADPAIRRAACAAATGTPAAHAAVRARLADEDAEVRTAALACLVAGGAPDALEALAALARAITPADRARAAAVIAAAGPGAPAAELVAALLADPEREVTGAALAAAAALGVPSLVPALLARAGDAPAPALAAALATCGRTAEDALAVALADGARPLVARRAIAVALGALATPAAMPALAAALADDAVRDSAIAALARAARAGAPVDPAAVRAAIDRELRAAYHAMAAAEGLGRAESRVLPDGTHAAPPYLPDAPEGAAALLSKTLRDRQEQAKHRVFGLLAALYPAAELEQLHANLAEPDPARRANATEVLDGLLERDLRALVVPLVDDSPRYAKLAAVGPRLGLPEHGQAGWVAELLGAASPWLLACTAYYAGVHGIVEVTERLAALLAHGDDVVREAAFVALAQLAEPSRVRGAASALAADPFPPLAARAAALLS